MYKHMVLLQVGLYFYIYIILILIFYLVNSGIIYI